MKHKLLSLFLLASLTVSAAPFIDIAVGTNGYITGLTNLPSLVVTGAAVFQGGVGIGTLSPVYTLDMFGGQDAVRYTSSDALDFILQANTNQQNLITFKNPYDHSYVGINSANQMEIVTLDNDDILLHAHGTGATTVRGTFTSPSTGTGSEKLGIAASAGNSGTAMGYAATAGVNTTALGNSAGGIGSIGGVVIGKGTVYSNNSGVVIGAYSYSDSGSVVAIGNSMSITGGLTGLVAIGAGATAADVSGLNQSLVIGQTAHAGDSRNTVVGAKARGSAVSVTAIGRGARGTNAHVVAIGRGAYGWERNSVNIGFSGATTGNNDVYFFNNSLHKWYDPIDSVTIDLPPQVPTVIHGPDAFDETGSVSNVAGGDLILMAGRSTGTNYGGALRLQVASSPGASSNTKNTAVDVLTVNTNGRVGIGTRNPVEKFDVVGNVSIRGSANKLYSVNAGWSDYSPLTMVASRMHLNTLGTGSVRIGSGVDAQKTLDVTGTFMTSGDATLGSNATVSGNLTATNGSLHYQLVNIPTNSIPPSSTGVTNYVLLNLTNTIGGGGISFVATNVAAAGSFLITRPTVTTTAWP